MHFMRILDYLSSFETNSVSAKEDEHFVHALGWFTAEDLADVEVRLGQSGGKEDVVEWDTSVNTKYLST